MLGSNLEYVSLRLLRRFVLSDRFLLRFGGLVPYYRTNLNQVDPAPVADSYVRHLASANYSPEGKHVLEIGVGRTNSTCYEIAARFPTASLIGFEPYVEFGGKEDEMLLRAVASRHRREPASLAGSVCRVRDLDCIADNGVDLVLSNSVLEHVADPLALFRRLRHVLAPGGAMLHLVDYRDHFFKYPYHFLQFDRATWNRWLNPGDLPVWRLYDHVEQLEAAGFSVSVLGETRDPKAFSSIAADVSPVFRRDDERVQVMTAALWATAAGEP